ncbi:MAG: uridine kinase [Flavobacteriales bacterium]|jgi:uridine kinase|nr:uridine kinase [Flavobacteriales bacterium]
MLVIGIAGGTGCGKTTVVKRIVDALPEGSVAVLSQDSYYRDRSDIPLEERKELNFDHPDAIEFELLASDIRSLKEGREIQQPTYSYITCTRGEETVTVSPRKVIIVEGILVLQSRELRPLLDIKIYVDTDDDDRLSRVIRRDIIERGRTATDVLDRYEKTVKPMHREFIEPSRRHADIIVPNYGDPAVAINILLTVIEKKIGNSSTRF